MAGNLIAKSLHGHKAGQPQGNLLQRKSSLEEIPLGEEVATISPTGAPINISLNAQVSDLHSRSANRRCRPSCGSARCLTSYATAASAWTLAY
jgi:hypothetical protein